jgi:site-specific recombinase XerD
MKESQNNSFFKPHTLTLKDLPFLQSMGDVNDGNFELQRSSKGYLLKTRITIPLDEILKLGHKGLAEYILRSLASQRPVLISFVLENSSLIELAKYFLLYRTASPSSLYGYVDRIWRYSKRVEKTPDELISDVMDGNEVPKMDRIPQHVKALEDYISELQDGGLSPGRINNYAKAIKTFYRINKVVINLPYPLKRQSTRKDRSPTPEELMKLLDVADLRGKVIISMLALGGFREGTLVKLQYRDVKHDLEAGIIPLHIHVEAEITKGKYHDYDTYLGSEAVEFLKLYLDGRRKGLRKGKIPPEDINDDSPIIRDLRSKIPRPIGEPQIYKTIHNLYFKAGLLAQSPKGYELKVHSIRKFFKTQLLSLGMQSDYADYMMGHTIDTYHDVQSKGVKWLRSVYASANLRIRPESKMSERELLKKSLGALVREYGLDPDKVIMWDAFAEPHRTFVSPEDLENHQIRVLSSALKEQIKREIVTELQSTESSEIQRWRGGPAGTRTPDLHLVRVAS